MHRTGAKSKAMSVFEIHSCKFVHVFTFIDTTSLLFACLLARSTHGQGQ